MRFPFFHSLLKKEAIEMLQFSLIRYQRTYMHVRMYCTNVRTSTRKSVKL